MGEKRWESDGEIGRRGRVKLREKGREEVRERRGRRLRRHKKIRPMTPKVEIISRS